MFIVFEGLDGCGKTTQAKLLADFLADQGNKVILTAEPTKGRIGLFIREILGGRHEVNPKTLALMFTADRYEHLGEEVEPAIGRGDIVISERYYHSTIAYQAAQGVDRGWLIDLNKFAPKPDITLYLDVKPKTGAGRTKTGEIFENPAFLEKVRDNYRKFDSEMVKVDAERPIKEVFNDIKRIILTKL